ncbi:hypothetical protein [Corynebacterium sp. sy039]|uniref:GAP1-N2 domain-containing protein n=1 Tax=Corynebacterium sp. sy039 TaxID=2599641 RepID=UPI0011B6BB20|nr:hypothetical protein [Corynebacterium sp. sy039]QDZ43194.1 hypothetical protein FQV43_08535 [Corynebacterium sp. sy039]
MSWEEEKASMASILHDAYQQSESQTQRQWEQQVQGTASEAQTHNDAGQRIEPEAQTICSDGALTYASFAAATSSRKRAGWQIGTCIGQMSEEEKSSVISKIPTHLASQTPIPLYASAKDRQQFVRRTAWLSLAPHRAKVLIHSVPAGKDSANRAGNVFSTAHIFRYSHASESELTFYPASFIAAPELAEPFNNEIDSVQLSSTQLSTRPDSDPRALANPQQVMRELFAQEPAQLVTLGVIVDALASGEKRIILGVDHQQAALWIAAIGYCFSPETAQELYFSTFERENTLAKVSRARLVAIPRSDVAQVRENEQETESIVIDIAAGVDYDSSETLSYVRSGEYMRQIQKTAKSKKLLEYGAQLWTDPTALAIVVALDASLSGTQSAPSAKAQRRSAATDLLAQNQDHDYGANPFADVTDSLARSGASSDHASSTDSPIAEAKDKKTPPTPRTQVHNQRGVTSEVHVVQPVIDYINAHQGAQWLDAIERYPEETLCYTWSAVVEFLRRSPEHLSPEHTEQLLVIYAASAAGYFAGVGAEHSFLIMSMPWQCVKTWQPELQQRYVARIHEFLANAHTASVLPRLEMVRAKPNHPLHDTAALVQRVVKEGMVGAPVAVPPRRSGPVQSSQQAQQSQGSRDLRQMRSQHIAGNISTNF